MITWTLQIKTVATVAAMIALCTAPFWLGPDHSPRSAEPVDGNDLVVVMRTARHLTDQGDMDALVQRLRDAGVAETWVQFKQDETDEVRGGEVFYPSESAAVTAGYEDDRIGRFVQLLAGAGIRVSAWIPCLNDVAAWEVNPQWRAWAAHEDQPPTEQHGWLCPSSAEVVEYQARIVKEVAERYPLLSGIYTDFIRYDDDFSCVCPRCMAHLNDRMSDGRSEGAAISAHDVVIAAKHRDELWKQWTDMRAEMICDVVDELRDGIEEVRPGLWFGACVLPFSATDYSFNTQSGQDYYEMARVGLDELVVMGYWDDWEKSPAWLADGLKHARELVKGECDLSCLIDGDMSIRRTWLTLDAIAIAPLRRLGYFNYWAWRDVDLERIERARSAAESGAPPRPAFTAVAIRIDTEPDDARRYDTVMPDMITRLVDMFDQEHVQTTFVTCGRIAELQPQAVRYAAEHGHEIACHAYDHEQLDSHSPQGEREAINRGLDALAAAGCRVVGFGAPRNSITENGRDLLIERGLEYDGSAAYDPMMTLLDAEYARHSSGDGRRIIVVPFVIPNDWDALRAMKRSPQEMKAMWVKRLQRVAESGEAVFVLDVHQWLASRDQDLEVLRDFIRFAKSRPDCRVMSLREAAEHARGHIAVVEQAASAAASTELGR